MDKKTAKRIADTMAQSLPNTENDALYLGQINDEHIFYFKRTIHGGHIGLPPYYSVKDSGSIALIKDTEILLKALKLKQKIKGV